MFLEMANEVEGDVDFEEWRQLQAWLQTAEHRVTIPYARELARLIPPIAVRLRRDFGAILALIRAHAVLHQANCQRDSGGRIIATTDEYAAVRDLVAGIIAAGVGATVPTAVRETVDAVQALAPPSGVMALAVAK